MSAPWIREILDIQTLTLEGIDITSNLISLAGKAQMIQGLAPGSVPIILPSGSVETSFSSMAQAMSAGTKFWDAYIYLTLKRHSDQNVRNRYREVFVVSYADPSDFDPLIIPRIAISQVLLWLTRGGLANSSSQAPLPKMIRNINQFQEGEMVTEGAYMASVMSFDPKLLNLKAVFSMAASELGFDIVFMQRIKLSIAGHKPLKVVNDNWSLIQPNLLQEGLTDRNGRMSDLVRILREKAVAGMTYARLHPGHDANLAQVYTGFYKTCLHAIVSVMSAFDPSKFDNNLAIINSRGLFNSDAFMRRLRDQDAGVKNYQSTVEMWNLTQLSTDFGDLWIN